MPTIEFDDQFVLEPAAPVRERYDMVAILRRNVANLEIALKQQTERAKAAEAELEAVREDNHAMMLEIDGMRTELARLRAAPAIPADHNIEKETPDCRACANRGRINGLSQESYCDSCVYQGRSWRKNHFVDAVKRRCEACAILPCSCK